MPTSCESNVKGFQLIIKVVVKKKSEKWSSYMLFSSALKWKLEVITTSENVNK